MSSKVAVSRAIDKLQTERRALIEDFRPLNQAQLDFKPGRSSWSVGEVVDHVRRAEDLMTGYMRELLQQGRSTGKGYKSVGIKELPFGVAFVPDVLMLFPPVLQSMSMALRFSPPALRSFLFANPLVKLKASPRMLPMWGIPRSELIKSIEKVRTSTVKMLEESYTMDLTRFRFDHPILGDHNIYSLLELMGGHDQRHRVQIRAIKSHRNFPKS